MKDTFERVTCITMPHTPKRWKRCMADMPEDWPFREVEKVDATFGKKTGVPDWWNSGKPAWGCYRSHLRIIEECLTRGIKSVLLLEDDFICCDNFAERIEIFLKRLPDDWEMLYLGGQHLHIARHPPEKINEQVYRPFNVNRTHAFALRGNGLRKIYSHLNWVKDWKRGHHIDHHLGRLVQRRKMPIYCPEQWLIGQNDERSTINGRSPIIRFWADSVSTSEDEALFVIVLGIHRSGSSCLAGVCHRLGVYMGDKFIGCEPDGGYEACELARKLEAAWPFPGTEMRHSQSMFERKVRPWILQKLNQVRRSESFVGGKYPHLCVYAPAIENICGNRLRVVHIDRPLEESIASLIHRSNGHHTDDILRHHQEVFYAHKIQFLNTTKVPVHTIQYSEMLANPAKTVRALAQFLTPLQPSDSRIQDATAYINPELRHIGRQVVDKAV